MAATTPRLSARQERMLEFIAEFRRKHGYPPTVREIGRAAGISSTSVVDYNLNVLEKGGHIRRDREISRGIELLGEAAERERISAVSVPVIGQIAAGQPIEAIPGLQDTIELSAALAPEDAFALRVKGKSMIEDLIDDGDLVVVKPGQTADNGDIVVALVVDEDTPEGAATLKRLYREKGRVRLQPRNPDMAPIYVDPNNLRIQGKVVSVIRQLA
jgi:repressor LexA